MSEPTSPAALLGAPREPARRGRWIAGAAIALAVVAIAIVVVRWRAAPEGVTSLLVTPFAALTSSDRDQTYLEAGVADAVVTRLGAIAALRVPPTAAYQAGDDPFTAAERLGVDAVLTGTLQRAGDRIRVTAQLSRVADHRQIWAGRFDDRFTDIFSVQDQIAERIAANLQTRLSAAQQAALRRRETTSAEAYDLYLKGRAQWSIRTPGTIREAIELYQRAIAIDARFALAYAGLADAYTITASGLPPETRFPLGRRAAEQAIALDDGLAEAHNALALIAYKVDWDWRRSEQEFRRAIALNPSYALARHWFGEMLGLIGRTDDAVEQFRQARSLDPYSPTVRVDFSIALVNGGRLDEARALIEEGLRANLQEWRMYWAMTKLLVAEGRLDEANASDLTYRELSGSPPEEVATLRDATRRGGRPALLRALVEHDLARFTRAERAPYGLPTTLAAEYAELRDREQTLKWLTIAADRKEDAAVTMKGMRVYQFLAGDPQYEALLRRVGFP